MALYLIECNDSEVRKRATEQPSSYPHPPNPVGTDLFLPRVARSLNVHVCPKLMFEHQSVSGLFSQIRRQNAASGYQREQGVPYNSLKRTLVE